MNSLKWNGDRLRRVGCVVLLGSHLGLLLVFDLAAHPFLTVGLLGQRARRRSDPRSQPLEVF